MLNISNDLQWKLALKWFVIFRMINQQVDISVNSRSQASVGTMPTHWS